MNGFDNLHDEKDNLGSIPRHVEDEVGEGKQTMHWKARWQGSEGMENQSPNCDLSRRRVSP
jgi:hypothetical protein